jgi:hypothetical protein
MRQDLSQSCTQDARLRYDSYAPPAGRNLPVVIHLKEGGATKAKRSRRGPAKTAEMFAVAQGFSHINLSLASNGREKPEWSAQLIRQALECISTGSSRFSGDSSRLFLLASGKNTRLALEATMQNTTKERSGKITLPAGLVLIGPSEPPVFSPAPNHTGQVLLVDTGRNEEILGALAMAKWIEKSGATLRLSPERKRREALLSDYGMASDQTTRHIATFIHERLRAIKQAQSLHEKTLL